MNLLFTHFDYFIECIFAREAILVVQIFLHQIVPTMRIYGAIDDQCYLYLQQVQAINNFIACIFYKISTIFI